MVNFDDVFNNAISGFQIGSAIGQRNARIKEQRLLREQKAQEHADAKKLKEEEAASKTRKDLREGLLKNSFDAVEKANKAKQVEAEKAQKSELQQQKLLDTEGSASKKGFTKQYNRSLLSELQAGLKQQGFDAFSSRRVPTYRTFSDKDTGTTEEDNGDTDTAGLSDDEVNAKIFESIQDTSKPTKSKKSGTRTLSKVQIGDKFLEDSVTKALKGGKISDSELTSDDAYDLLLGGATKDLTEEEISKGREMARKITENVSQKLRGSSGLFGSSLKAQPLKEFVASKAPEEQFDSRVLVNTNLAEEAFLQNPELSHRPLTAHASAVLTTLKERNVLPSNILEPILAVADNMSRASSKAGLRSVYKKLLNELITAGKQSEAKAVSDLINEID